jgi:hypothetical protein
MRPPRKFRDPQLDRAYGIYAANPPVIGPLGEAYRKGRAGQKAQWPSQSLAYAAWAAGRDEMRKGLKCRS